MQMIFLKTHIIIINFKFGVLSMMYVVTILGFLAAAGFSFFYMSLKTDKKCEKTKQTCNKLYIKPIGLVVYNWPIFLK